MKRKPFGILRHAVKMVGRNIRSYAMLSVTIILSFTILLGFMGFMDSEHYNNYKKDLTLDRGFLRFDTRTMSSARVAQLQEKAAEYGTTHSLQYYRTVLQFRGSEWRLASGERFSSWPGFYAYAIPRECWYLEKAGSEVIIRGMEAYTVTWLDGRETPNVTLEKGEIIMDEQMFRALGLSRENNRLEMKFSHVEDSYAQLYGTYTVVGTVPSDEQFEIEFYTNERTGEVIATRLQGSLYSPVVIFSLDDLNPTTFPSEGNWRRYVFFHSDQPENVHKMLESMEPELHIYATYERQEWALEKIRTEKGTKAIIAALLMLILGINLYSSFENALNDRKFEIGVKRAMGASGFSIIRQFFYESMIVMIANIVIAVSFVVDIGLLLKLYRQITVDNGTNPMRYTYQTYTLYITPYSVGMFAVCAVVLTVVFSFVFAYKTTQVQIVDYLKAE